MSDRQHWQRNWRRPVALTIAAFLLSQLLPWHGVHAQEDSTAQEVTK